MHAIYGGNRHIKYNKKLIFEQLSYMALSRQSYLSRVLVYEDYITIWICHHQIRRATSGLICFR